MQTGGRTGLTALAGAVLLLACLMLRDLTELNWDDTTEVLPPAVTALAQVGQLGRQLAGLGWLGARTTKPLDGAPSR